MRAVRQLLGKAHNDLASYRAWVHQNNVDTTTTVHAGTLYEYTVQASLKRFGLTLKHTGSKDDKGIDLLGTWETPSLPSHPLRVLVQCKALQRQVSPNLIRELEGAFVGMPASWGIAAKSLSDVRQITDTRDEVVGDVLAMLVTPKNATKGVRDAMGRSRLPMAFAKVRPDGLVEQMLWNSSAAGIGLEGIAVTTRFVPGLKVERTAAGEVREQMSQEVVLTWHGELLEKA